MKRTASLILSIITLVTANAEENSAQPSPRDSVRAAYVIKTAPITLAFSTVGGLGTQWWYLSVNSAGDVELVIESTPAPIRKRFQLTKKQWADIRQKLLESRFFDLKSEYGLDVFDSNETTLTVVAGAEVKTVVLKFLEQDADKLQEPARALQVLLAVVDCLGDPVATGLTELERTLVKEAAAANR